jgi:hypothetical protein
VILDDESDDPSVREQRGRLTSMADERRVRVEVLSGPTGCSDLACYASLLGQGRYAAAYLGLGLGRGGAG